MILEAIREFEIEKFDAENEFKEELDRLVTTKYNGIHLSPSYKYYY